MIEGARRAEILVLESATRGEKKSKKRNACGDVEMQHPVAKRAVTCSVFTAVKLQFAIGPERLLL